MIERSKHAFAPFKPGTIRIIDRRRKVQKVYNITGEEPVAQTIVAELLSYCKDKAKK